MWSWQPDLLVNVTSSKKSLEKKQGLSRAEKIAIPMIIMIAAWVVYSLMQPSLPIQQQTGSSSTALSGSSNALDFTLPVIGPNGPTGESFSLSSLQGKVVVLEFMEPSCPHCQSMAPILEQLHQKYGGNVTFISVSGPWEGTTQNDVAKFVRDYGSSWTYVYDSSGSTMSTYGVNATPTLFIIGRNGAIVTSLQGQQSYATLESVILQSLRS
jgi:thiol-disulfide isomerase/thioredoxin